LNNDIYKILNQNSIYRLYHENTGIAKRLVSICSTFRQNC